MAVIELLNTTNMTIVLADNFGNYGSMAPHSIMPVDDALLAKECIAKPIQKGWIKVKSGGKFAGKSGSKKIVAAAVAQKEKGGDEPVSFFPPEQDGQAAKVVSHDFEKAAEEAAKKAEETTEVIGEKIVKQGRKKKLVKVSMQKGGPKKVVEISERVKKQLPPVIEINGEEEDAGVTKSAQWIIPSTIPGAAQLVSMEDMGWDQLNKLAKETNVVVDSLVRDRKALIYSNQSKSERMELIARTMDISFLKQLEEGELDMDLLRAIREKIKGLEGENVQ